MRKNTGYANPLWNPLVIIFENYSSRSSNSHPLRISTGFANSKFTMRIKFADHFFTHPLCEIPLCESALVKVPLRNSTFAKFPLCEPSPPLHLSFSKKKRVKFFFLQHTSQLHFSLLYSISRPFAKLFHNYEKFALKPQLPICKATISSSSMRIFISFPIHHP